MAKKVKALPTRDEKILSIRENLHTVDTSTRVKAWVFQVEKSYYVIVSYFMPLYGNTLEVFPSTRRGVKTSEKSLYKNNNCADPYVAFDTVIESLVIDPIPTEPLETTTTI